MNLRAPVMPARALAPRMAADTQSVAGLPLRPGGVDGGVLVGPAEAAFPATPVMLQRIA
ncbi:hypothetical protein OHS81_12990 [Streptomyces sp. NBC_00400]|uniref:hypothetical protein n=1 Tax=Streptomyces sp. NBC_00400 TaxID=2975737 RepID=UPI002E2347AD